MDWIKCDEKMPDHTNRIITWDGQLVQEGHYSFIEKKIIIPGFKSNNKITHWMELPQPPLD